MPYLMTMTDPRGGTEDTRTIRHPADVAAALAGGGWILASELDEAATVLVRMKPGESWGVACMCTVTRVAPSGRPASDPPSTRKPHGQATWSLSDAVSLERSTAMPDSPSATALTGDDLQLMDTLALAVVCASLREVRR